MKKNIKIKTIVFIIGFILMILSLIIIGASITMNYKSIGITHSEEGFIKRVVVEQLPKPVLMDENLKDFNSVKIDTDFCTLVSIIVIDNAKENKLTANINGTYEINNKVLVIDHVNSFDHNLNLTLYVKQDLKEAVPGEYIYGNADEITKKLNQFINQFREGGKYE